jgi:hypothetical protein
VSENIAVREIFGPKKDEVGTLGQYTTKNISVYTGHSIVRMVKSRLRWTGFVAMMQGKQEIFTECLWGYLFENGHSEDKEEIRG